MSRTIPLALLTLSLVVGSALRLDAITDRWGYVNGPRAVWWLQRGAHWFTGMFPPAVRDWSPEPEYPHQDDRPSRYRSDPYTYLRRAREMSSFYEAHHREPVFPYAVKGHLRALGDQDVAVSFASATFAILTILTTYAMGTLAFSRWAGGLAAFAFAIERDAIFWGVGGWRDDAFAFAVTLAVCALIRYARQPSGGNAVALGAVSALACLVRIFAITFLVPAFLYMLWSMTGPWRTRLQNLAIAAATAAVLVAPYLVNCWLVYGDPLYALNYQPVAYLEWENASPATNPGAVGYIGSKLLTTPFETLDTAVLGMTSYPFLNKWSGFDPWWPGAGSVLAGAAIIGLTAATASPNGRLLLLVLLSAQVPFAFTWRLSSDWRYTQFAYPFFLVCAALAITGVLALAQPSRWTRSAVRWPARATLLHWTLLFAAIVGVVVLVMRVLPVMKVREALITNGAATIEAGPRDGAFFREGWSGRVTTGNVTARVASGSSSTVDLPIPRPADFKVTVRLDPVPPPSSEDGARPTVRIFFNRTLVHTVSLSWDPERVGSYDFMLRRELVAPGVNQLVFTSEAPEAGFKLWYVLVQPVS